MGGSYWKLLINGDFWKINKKFWWKYIEKHRFRHKFQEIFRSDAQGKEKGGGGIYPDLTILKWFSNSPLKSWTEFYVHIRKIGTIGFVDFSSETWPSNCVNCKRRLETVALNQQSRPAPVWRFVPFIGYIFSGIFSTFFFLGAFVVVCTARGAKLQHVWRQTRPQDDGQAGRWFWSL